MQDVWPCEYYNLDKDDPNNRLRDFIGDEAKRLKYFEEMSRAYAFMCSGYSVLFTEDINNIPMNGIWGQVEYRTATRDSDFEPPKGETDFLSHLPSEGRSTRPGQNTCGNKLTFVHRLLRSSLISPKTE